VQTLARLHGSACRERLATEGLDGRSARTVTLNCHVLKPVTAVIGYVELRKLTAHDVRHARAQLAGGLRVRPAADGAAHSSGGLGTAELELIATLTGTRG
jgi:hypothetical protein